MILHLKSDADVAKALAGPKPVLLDCTATWCGPCRMMAPVFETLSKEYPNVQFVSMDIDACQASSTSRFHLPNPKQATAGRLGIQAVPTFLGFNKGQQIPNAVVKGADQGGLKRLADQIAKMANPWDAAGSGQKLGGQSAPHTGTAARGTAPSGKAGDCRIKVKLANGTSLTGAFDQSTTIADLIAWVAERGGGSVRLAGSQGGELEASHTLEEAGLAPSGVVRVLQ